MAHDHEFIKANVQELRHEFDFNTFPKRYAKIYCTPEHCLGLSENGLVLGQNLQNVQLGI